MTEYLILSLNRALPLVWEYNRQIAFNLTFSRTYGSIPKSVLSRVVSVGTTPGWRIDSTNKRIFRAFRTPPQPSITGVARVSKPRLYRTAFTLHSWTGNPQFRIDLHYANPNGTPGEYITSFAPAIADAGYTNRVVYIDFGIPGAFTSAPELEWDTLYSIVLVPTFANSSNYGDAINYPPSGDTLGMVRIGTSTDGGTTWSLIDNRDWANVWGTLNYVSVGIAWYYESSEATIPVAKSSEAFRSYFNGWVSRTTLPSGFNLMAENINGVTNLTAGTEIRFTDSYTHWMRFYTTADVAGFTQTDVASFIWRYDINPVTIDMFYASEAYLQRIDFLANGSSIRLNDSYEQEFSGNSGQSVTFNPPILFWKAQVLSGAVRLSALVFE
jgi:hypothetical protein